MSDGETTTRKHRRPPWRKGESGNPAGRPKGARHTALLALDAIGEAGAMDVMAAVVTAAKGGDMRAAEILLRRVWPERKGRPAPLAIPPITTIRDSAAAMGAVVQAVANGELSAEEGAAVAAVIESHRKAIEAGELEARVAALEAAGKGGGV